MTETEIDLLIFRQQKMHEALVAAQDSLESLRRGHGTEVSSLCFPALNLVREAVNMCRPKNETDQ